jgi:DNA-directed RNA polymerase subunit RPC12/RpoP
MIYECDDCKKQFEDSEILLKPLPATLEVIESKVRIYNVISKRNFRITPIIQTVEGDCSMHCPHCGKWHRFGFDVVKKKRRRK